MPPLQSSLTMKMNTTFKPFCKDLISWSSGFNHNLTFYSLNEFCLDSSDRGSITNFKEVEIPFLALEETHPHSLSPPTTTSSSSVDGKLATSTRTTRSRSRAVEVTKSPSPIVEKEFVAASYETRPLHQVEYSPSPAPKPSSPSTRTTEVEELDEDDDELDLIGPSTSILREQPSTPRISPRRTTPIPSANANQESTSTIEVLEQEPIHTISISEPLFKRLPVSQAMKSSLIEEEHADILMGVEGTKERTPQPLNDVSEKDSEVDNGMGMDEETEVAQGQSMESALEEEMDVDNETKSDAENSPPIRTRDDLFPSSTVDDFETGVSGIATQHPVPDTVEESPPDKAAGLEKMDIQSHIRSNPGEPGAPVIEVLKPPKYIPMHFPLPPSIQEAILIPAPTTNDEEISFNLDFEPEPTVSSPVPTNIENRQQLDVKYTLPPLSVLPTDFIRKVKTRRKKDGKREKDDAVPMGLTRWGATIMANPLWKRVAKATKCLNTREWGVRWFNYLIYGYNLLKV